MEKIKVRICLLGYQRYLDQIKKLQNYSSELFEITDTVIINHLPESDTDNWGYSDTTIVNILKTNNIKNDKYDLCMCFIDPPIEDNYFSRDLSLFDSKTVVCSLYQVEEIFEEKKYQFI